jgi:hypothetical protein
LEYAVELELLDKNPMPALKWTPPKTTHGVDRRRVANPIQGRTLLQAVGEQRGGRRLFAFFGCLYYAALDPRKRSASPSTTCRSPSRDGASCTSNAPSPTPAMTIGRVWRRGSAGRVHRRGRHVAAGEDALRPTARGRVTWLNGGVPPTTVAEWAEHSVEVMLRIYAKCLDGGDALVRRRVQAALGYADTDNNEATGSNPFTSTAPT